MLAYFPTPYPDELLFSVVSRLAEIMQFPNSSDFSRVVYGRYRNRILIDLPNYLDYLLTVLPPGNEMTLNRLLTEHTLFPFYQPFVPVERAEKLKEVMRGQNQERQGPYTYLGLRTWIVKLPQFFRFCPECVKADRIQYGQTYWHRVHHVPGVHICPRHGSILQDSSIPVYYRPPSHLHISAEQSLTHINSVPEHFPFSTYKILRELAEDAYWLLTHPHHQVTVASFRHRFKLLLTDHKLVTQAGKIRSSAFLAAFWNHYSPELLQFLGCPLEHDNHTAWPRQTVTVQWLKHPLQYLLIIRWLGLSIEEFFALPAEILSFEEGPFPCLNPTCQYYRQLVIKESQVEPRTTNGQPYATFACECGFIYGRFGPDYEPEDRFRLDRIVALGPVWTNQWRKLQADPTLSQTEIARRLNINRTTVKKWSQLHPPTPKQKDVLPSKNLSSNLTSLERQRQSEDVELAEQIRLATLALLTQPGKPARITRSTIFRSFNRMPFTPQPEILPLAAGTLAIVIESNQSFAIRRVEWAIDYLASQHISPLKTQIFRQIGTSYYFRGPKANQSTDELLEQLMNRTDQTPSLRHTLILPAGQDWLMLDTRLAERIEISAGQLRKKPGYPTRITGVSLAAEMGELELILGHLEMLPQTASALAKAIEPVGDFVERVLDWVLTNDPEVNNCDQLREFVTLTGLKPYTDEPMVAALVRAAFTKLQESRPANKQIDWQARDKRLASAVRRAATILKNRVEPIAKITRKAISDVIDTTEPLGVGVMELLLSCLEKLPETARALDEVVETPEQFAIRRLESVAACYCKRGLRPTRSQLVEEAYVRPLLTLPLIALTINRILAELADLPSVHEFKEQQYWSLRDAELAVLVIEAAEYLKTQSDPFIWISGRAIGRYLNYELHGEYLKYLPKTATALAQVVETSTAFASRRIQWFADFYRDRRVCPSRSNFIRVTGVFSMVKKEPYIDDQVSEVLQSLTIFPLKRRRSSYS